jgi:predicted TIM-barrel fold metal-dependent hydrolase
LRFAVPRLQSSNDETPPKSGAIREGMMLTRRKFIGTIVVAGAALTTSAQHARPQPASKRTIVDAQVHLWKANSPDWAWEPGARPQLPEPFTIERALPMMDEAGVDRVVIVPAGVNDRNDYALEAAKRYPNRFAVMGRIRLQDPKSAALLPTWKQQPGMLGVRLSFNTPQTLASLSDGTADWFWPAAEKAGLPIMFLAVGEVPKFARIAERHPQLTLIIDHMGLNSSSRANRLTESIPAAIDQAVALAKYPNVSVKFSGAVGNSLDPYPFRDMTVHLKRLFDAYGPQRCHWGTDITNSLAKASYGQRITHFTEELSFLSESDKDWVMGRAILARLKWA